MRLTGIRWRVRLVRRTAVALVATCALGAPVGAAAQDAPAGETTIRVGSAAREKLARAGIEVSARRPAWDRARRLGLPVRGGEVGAIARVLHAGSVRLGAGGRHGRRVQVRRIAATLSAGEGHLTARVAGTQYTLARLRKLGDAPFDPTTGEVHAATRLELTPAARAAIAGRLGAAVPRRLGRVTIAASLPLAPASTAEPEPLIRPAGALDVSTAAISWRVRESFICYIHAQGGPGASAVSPAVPQAPVAYPPADMSAPCSAAPQGALTYTYDFPASAFADGWFDPATGVAAIHATGGVRFRKDVFGLDLETSLPELELNGPDSRLVHTYHDHAAPAEPSRRAVTADLDPAAVAPQVATEPDGDTVYTYERIPGFVPDGPTASELAGFYADGAPFGWVSVTFTVPAEAP